MEECLLKHFILNNEIRSSCDFNAELYSQGNTVYEVLRVIQQKPLFLEEHVERFFQSLYLSNIQAGISVSELINSLRALIESNQLINGNIRFQNRLTLQNHPEFLSMITSAHYLSSDWSRNGVQVLSLEAERENPNVKSAHLLARKKANRIISESTAFEVLLLNSVGYITEGSRSNVFFISGEKLITPPLSEVLAGVTRSKIIELAKKHKIPIIERPVKFTELPGFDAAFLSGTSINILPINQLDKMAYQRHNPLMIKLQKLLDGSILRYINHFTW